MGKIVRPRKIGRGNASRRSNRPPSEIEGPSLKRFQNRLLAWYDKNRRDLPWRRSKDSYTIFVSEMMLQQTQVKTVLPYFERWMRRFPDWRALDKAPIEKVLKSWEGLGYYRRARNLKAAARMVREDFQDQLPETEEAIRLLPGVGPYSAGALLSIAFDQPFPLVDGNVQRVFSRLFALGGDLKHGLGHQKVWRIARHLLPVRRPGDFNQALMEWGATVCLPTNPLCPACPLASICLAKKLDRIDRYPSATVKTALKTVHMAAALFRDHDRILIQKRPETSRWWKGLWELPSAEGLDSVSALARLEEDLKVKLEPEPLVSTRHQVTHHKIDLRLYACKETVERPRSPSTAWIHPESSHRYPLSSAHSKLIRRWLEKDPQPSA